jgi:hypothetical protein
VPAVIGEGTLSKFQTMDGVFRYVSVTMPYFFPGDLTEEEYLAIVAHLAREHGSLGWYAPDGEHAHQLSLVIRRCGSGPGHSRANTAPGAVCHARFWNRCDGTDCDMLGVVGSADSDRKLPMAETRPLDLDLSPPDLNTLPAYRRLGLLNGLLIGLAVGLGAWAVEALRVSRLPVPLYLPTLFLGLAMVTLLGGLTGWITARLAGLSSQLSCGF